jgi:hypothetical protein
MVNKDQLDQTPEGKEVLALLAKHFSAEQFQPALTLIEQRYTDDQTVWDAELNHESKWPFLKTHSAHRLLIFFASPSHVAKIKAELGQHAAEAAIHAADSQAGQARATTKLMAERKSHPKARRAAQRSQGRKVAAARNVRRKPSKSQRSKPPAKRPKLKSRPAKAKKSRAKKN